MVSFSVYLNSDLHIGTPNFPNLIRNFPHPNGSNAQQVVFASGLLARPAQPRSKKKHLGIQLRRYSLRNVDDVKSFLNDAMLHARLMEISEVRERDEDPRSLRAKAPEN